MIRSGAAISAVGGPMQDITVATLRQTALPLPDMAAAVANLLRVPADRVNVKAGTNEGCDAIGRGEAIAAHATVLLAASAS